MSAFANLGFETDGGGGTPASWTRTTQASVFDIADYANGPKPWEDFEGAWDSNEGYVYAIDILLSNIEIAVFATVGVDTKHVEDFEELWSSNEGYVFTLSSSSSASYTNGGPTQNFDAFEGGWNSNEGYLYAFVGVGTDLAAGTFDTFAQERFEANWNSNEGYLYAFVGVGTDLTLASYGPTGPTNFEGFEAAGDWTDLVMTTV